MSKLSRQPSSISPNSSIDDSWLTQLENNLKKESVQSRQTDRSLFDQISSIMGNRNAKYPSVQAAVDDMMSRSGMTDYLRTSQNEEISKVSNQDASNKKSAQDQNSVINKKVNLTPIVITKNPNIKTTLENYIRSSKGNLPIPAIVSKIRSIYKDVSNPADWEDEKLIRLISLLNLEAKAANPENFVNESNLGNLDDQRGDSDVDIANTDAFSALHPANG